MLVLPLRRYGEGNRDHPAAGVPWRRPRRGAAAAAGGRRRASVAYAAARRASQLTYCM
eukprot:COSAG01_NODE_43_length_32320_cov_622.744763_28_plen_58_part_00